MHIHDQSVIETRERKANTPEDSSSFPGKKRAASGARDSNLQHPAHCADVLPAEPWRQSSWACQIFKVYARAKASLPDKQSYSKLSIKYMYTYSTHKIYVYKKQYCAGLGMQCIYIIMYQIQCTLYTHLKPW